jgi:hypothetical protein
VHVLLERDEVAERYEVVERGEAVGRRADVRGAHGGRTTAGRSVTP